MSDDIKRITQRDLLEFLRIENTLTDLSEEVLNINNKRAELQRRKTELLKMYGNSGKIYQVGGYYIRAASHGEYPNLKVTDVEVL